VGTLVASIGHAAGVDDDVMAAINLEHLVDAAICGREIHRVVPDVIEIEHVSGE
jgi:hypothetical protein